LRARLEEAEAAAAAEAWSRYHAYSAAVRKSEAAAAVLTSAEAAYRQSLASYQAGLISILDLLNAENQAAQARAQGVLVRHEALSAWIDLTYALGHLTPPDPAPLSPPSAKRTP